MRLVSEPKRIKEYDAAHAECGGRARSHCISNGNLQPLDPKLIAAIPDLPQPQRTGQSGGQCAKASATNEVVTDCAK